jgi:hypothetical protein
LSGALLERYQEDKAKRLAKEIHDEVVAGLEVTAEERKDRVRSDV